MGQTFIILLRAGPHNNANLEPVHSAKMFSDAGVIDGGQRANCPQAS